MPARIYTKCPICGEDVLSEPELQEHKCDICEKTYVSNYACQNGHHICGLCLINEYYDIAKEVCLKTKSKNPVEIAEIIMNHPNFAIVGCKHYFIPPIALFTAYKNAGGNLPDFENELEVLKKSATYGQTSMCQIGGLCGIPLALGRAMYSTNPDTVDPNIAMSMSNRAAANCMRELLNPDFNGPSNCCKRNVYITIATGVKYIREILSVDLELPNVVKCKYYANNPKCDKEHCQLYNGKNMMKYL